MKHIFLLITFLIKLSFLFAVSLDSIPIQEGLNKDYALLFAIEEFDNNDSWQNLPNTIKAVEEIAEELKISYGFQTEIVKNPTKTEVLEKLNEYSKIDYGKYGQFLVYFSGHGHIKEKGKKRKIGFLVTKDSKNVDEDKQYESYLRHTTFAEELNYLENCRHIFVLIDACFSSTFDSELNNANTRADPKRKYLPTKKSMQDFQKEELKYVSRLFLASGNKETLAGNKYGYSPFTNTFLSALRDDNLKKDGIIIFDALKVYFKNARLNPRPKGGYFGDHEAGGNFLFVRQARKLSLDKIQIKNLDEVNNGLINREDYPFRIDALKIYTKHKKIIWEVAARIAGRFKSNQYEWKNQGFKNSADLKYHFTKAAIINNLYNDLSYAPKLEITYEAPFFVFKFEGEMYNENLSYNDIDWIIIEKYIENKYLQGLKKVNDN